MNPPHSGFHIGSLIGYRIWRIDRNRLASLNGYVWKPGTNGPAHGVDVGGSGGFYAFKELSEALELSGGPRSRHGRRHPHAVGKVSLWGEIVEHEFGYRAQFAKIIELIPRQQPCTRTVMETARERMGEALWARYMAAWEKERAASLAAWTEQMAALRRYYELTN
jgi:hypothetical protein